MQKLSILLALYFFSSITLLYAQTKKLNESNLTVTLDSMKLYGTLTMPLSKNACPVMLLIAGSGQTDRNGNQKGMETNAYQQLAEKLAEDGIATLRFDKRGVGESVVYMQEADLRFDNFITDVNKWIKLLKSDKRFSKVIVAGHSEGSLIGMVACNTNKPNAFISISGAGESIDKILKLQLKTAIPDSAYYAKSCLYLDTLAHGDTLIDADPLLASLFRPSIQPYMISWIKYDPANEIQKLSMPILIIQGSHDIQVDVKNAQQLKAANPKAIVKIIADMNHVLKIAPMDRTENLATYSDPSLQVVPEFIKELEGFIRKL